MSTFMNPVGVTSMALACAFGYMADNATRIGWNEDNRLYVYARLNEMTPAVRPVVYAVIHRAYDAGAELRSDGITLMPELDYGVIGIKHPCGVAHDWLYSIGLSNPFIQDRLAYAPECQRDACARLWADDWLGMGLHDYGNYIAAPIFRAGVRVGGWAWWDAYRRRERETGIYTRLTPDGASNKV